MPEKEEEQREKILADIEAMRRRVLTGEVTGLIMVGFRGPDDRCYTTRVGGHSGPRTILNLQRMSAREKRLFFERELRHTDPTPRLHILTSADDEERDDDR